MKTKISLVNYLNKFGGIIFLPIWNIVSIGMIITEGLNIKTILIFIGFLALTIFGYFHIFRNSIKFDIENKKIKAKGFIFSLFKSIDFETSFHELKELIVEKKGKYSFDLVFKSKYSSYDRKIFMNLYRFTFFGRTQFNKTIKVINSWNEYLIKK